MRVLGSHGRQRGFVLRRANASCKVLQWETWLVLEVLGEALVFRGGKGSAPCLRTQQLPHEAGRGRDVAEMVGAKLVPRLEGTDGQHVGRADSLLTHT